MLLGAGVGGTVWGKQLTQGLSSRGTRGCPWRVSGPGFALLTAHGWFCADTRGQLHFSFVFSLSTLP